MIITQVCSKCRVEKPILDFFVRDKNRGLYHKQCKDCYRLHRSETYRQHYAKYKDTYLVRAKLRRETIRKEFRDNMLQYFIGKKCQVCGEEDSRTFEFDHIDPRQKSFSVSQGVRLGYSWANIRAEMDKCQILCANCHKKRTAEQFGWYKN